MRPLRREERLEDAGLSLGVHARAGIGDGQHHVVSGDEWGMQARVVLIELDVGGFDRQLAAGWHCVARVYGQIHDDLLNLPHVGPHCAQPGRRDHYQVDIFTDQAA